MRSGDLIGSLTDIVLTVFATKIIVLVVVLSF